MREILDINGEIKLTTSNRYEMESEFLGKTDCSILVLENYIIIQGDMEDVLKVLSNSTLYIDKKHNLGNLITLAKSIGSESLTDNINFKMEQHYKWFTVTIGLTKGFWEVI